MASFAEYLKTWINLILLVLASIILALSYIYWPRTLHILVQDSMYRDPPGHPGYTPPYGTARCVIRCHCSRGETDVAIGLGIEPFTRQG